MVEVVVRKLDSTELKFRLCPGATLLDLKVAVSMCLDLPDTFITLVFNGVECADPTATVVESSVGWYQVLVVLFLALNVLIDCNADVGAKLQALKGLAKLGPSAANTDCINTIVNCDVHFESITLFHKL